jgi:hypothetical protein
MAISLIAISLSVYDYLPGISEMLRGKSGIFAKGAVIILLLVLLSPFVLRAFTVFEVPFATKNIYDQHYQMSQFVKNYAGGNIIAANDIGMIEYYSASEVLDLYGLANMDIARAKLTNRYTTETIFDLTKSKNIKLAIVYANGYEMYGGLPPSWIKLAEWTMTDRNIVCGYETVTFFSLTQEDADGLRKKLIEYSTQLPKSVAYKNF